MASLIPGYEYDIFISYRQKDNKGDRWVSEFVEALRIELESTCKEDVNVYFDINPHDGLLETHDVNASLKEKLKCLVFIPIISRTYCDPNSFAWENEFKAFVDAASRDQLGLKITLPNGNVASRVLPIRIHDLDKNDILLCESLLGGVLRGIDFVYKSTGVNRPLRMNEDHPQDNLNKTYYRDQINKVANAIDEIIHSLISGKSPIPVNDSGTTFKESGEGEISKVNLISKFFSGITKKWLAILLAVILCISGALATYKYFIKTYPKKTIAVIPYTFPRNDNQLSVYAMGAMAEITSKLKEINNLSVRHSVSSSEYVNTEKNLKELSSDLNINYLVEINIRKTADNLQMGVVLKETKGNKQLWSGQYDLEEEHLITLFSGIAQIIARNLDVKFSPEEIKNIENNPTKNSLAYDNYITGNARLLMAMGNKFADSASFLTAIKMYDKAIESDPGFAIAYSRRAIARSWGIHVGQLNSTHIEKSWSDITDAIRIDKDLSDIQTAQGFYYYYCKKDYLNAFSFFKSATEKDPENYQPLFFIAMVCRTMGDWKMSQHYINKVIPFNIQDPLYLTNIGVSYTYLHKFDSALIYHQKAIDTDPGWSASYINKIETLLLKYGNTTEARPELDFLTKNTSSKQIEIKILLDIYDGKYNDAFSEASNTGPEDFEIKGNKYLYLAMISNLLDKPKNADVYYDTALSILQTDLLKDSTDAKIHGLTGIAYAGKGDKEKALAEGKRAIELTVTNKNKMQESDMILNLAKINTMLGLYEDAYDNIEYSLKNPSMLSISLLKIDPVWKPLQNRPEFLIILEKYSNI